MSAQNETSWTAEELRRGWAREDPGSPYLVTLFLGNGFYRVLPGWTEEEVLDDLLRTGSDRKRRDVGLREERELRQLIHEALGGAGFDSGPAVAEPGIDRLRRSLREWDGEWPPTQPAIAERVGWANERSVRTALVAARTTWRVELADAERNRGA